MSVGVIKREGDGRDNAKGSRDENPLYIDLSAMIREEGRDFFESPLLGSIFEAPEKY